MLTNHKVFEGKLVTAWTEVAHRDDGRPTDVRLVVDERDAVVGAVSPRYTLIRNADVIAALDLVADERGARVEPTRAAYHNGRSFYQMNLPEMGFQVSGDKSPLFPSVIVRNDYRGGGGLKVQAGIFRLACTNGLIVGQIVYATNQPHVGVIDVRKIMATALDRVLDTLAVTKLIAERATTVLVNDEVTNAIVEDTPERYLDELNTQMGRYRRELGDNMWAVAQAVSDVATHRMQTRATGVERERFNMGADNWAARQWTRIAALVEV